jgi:ketosteroid isomerase-like protein
VPINVHAEQPGKYFYTVIISIVMISCSQHKVTKVPPEKSILTTDEAFSKMSKELGMKKAFIEYIDDDGVLLRPGHPPIVGANAIEYLTEQNDSSYILKWEPSSASVAASGDLGYSYGIYNLQLQDTTLQGTYVSIWKKQKDGKWKFVLDTGNEGLAK